MSYTSMLQRRPIRRMLMLLFVVLAFMSLGTGPGMLLFAPMFLGAALYLHQPTAAEAAVDAAAAKDGPEYRPAAEYQEPEYQEPPAAPAAPLASIVGMGEY